MDVSIADLRKTVRHAGRVFDNMTGGLLADRNTCLVGDVERGRPLPHHLLVLDLAVGREEVFERHGNVGARKMSFCAIPDECQLSYKQNIEIELTAQRSCD